MKKVFLHTVFIATMIDLNFNNSNLTLFRSINQEIVNDNRVYLQLLFIKVTYI